MSELHGSLARLYMNGNDLSPLFRESEGGVDSDVIDTTTFGATADSNIVSPLAKSTVKADGLLDVDPTTGAHILQQRMEAAALSAAPTNIVTYMTRDTTLGDPGIVIVGSLPKQSVKSVLRDVAQTSFEAQGKRGGWCRALLPKGSLSAAGNGASLDNTALTLNGGIAVLHVYSMSGTTPVLTFKAQHSVDGTTWADLATHSTVNIAAATAGFAEAISTSGTVNRYLRYTLAVTSGTLTAVSAAVQFVRFP